MTKLRSSLALLAVVAALSLEPVFACMRGTGTGTRACVDQLFPDTPYSTQSTPSAPHYFSFDHDNACADFHVEVTPISNDPKLVVSQPRYSSQETYSYVNYVSDVRGISGVEHVVVDAMDHTAPEGSWNMAVHCDEPYCSGMTQYTILAWEEVRGNSTHTANGTLGADERHVWPVCQPHTCGTMTLEITTTGGDDMTLVLARDEFSEATDLSAMMASRLIGTDTWEIELRPDGGWLPQLLYLGVDCDSTKGCSGGSYEISYRSESGQCPPSVSDLSTPAEPESVFGEMFWSALIVAGALLLAGLMCMTGLKSVGPPQQVGAQRIPDSGSERDSKDLDEKRGGEEVPAAEEPKEDVPPPTPRPPTPRDADTTV